MFFDSHAHLETFVAQGTLPAVLRAAKAAGVSRLCTVGSNPNANRFSAAFAARHPSLAVAAVGLDPSQIYAPENLPPLLSLASLPHVAAIGEIGLDFFYSPQTPPLQRRLFESMLALALQLHKPVIIHSRNAQNDTLAMLRDFTSAWSPPSPHQPPGVLHCFTGPQPFAEHLLSLGFLISFSGILSFPNAASLRTLAKSIPTDRLLIETDSPYLAPVPFRGHTNEPQYLPSVAQALADARGESLPSVASTTTRNACRLFHLKPHPEPSP